VPTSVHPPPFLIHLLRQALDGHVQEQVFTGEHGGYLRRFGFNRRTSTAGDATASPA
jgi:hypothetical protein